jgi:hypothetical protein
VNEREVGKLIELASIVRPDYAGFAVHRPRAESSLDAPAQERIRHARMTLTKADFRWTSQPTSDAPCNGALGSASTAASASTRILTAPACFGGATAHASAGVPRTVAS